MRTLLYPCHDPSHGGFYMAEGALYIRIGLPPRVVSGDCLISSRYGLTARSLHCRRAYPMSRDWGCTSTCYRSSYVPVSSMRPWGLYLRSHAPHFHGSLYPMMDFTLRDGYGLFTPMSADVPWGFLTILLLTATVLGSRYFSDWYDNIGRCGLQRNV